MDVKWTIKGEKVTGRKHLREKIPCQDTIMSIYENNIYVIALSDGCSSEPNSEKGSELTTNFLCNYISKNYDLLYDINLLDAKKTILLEFLKKFAEYLMNNNLISGKGTSASDVLSIMEKYSATFQFVAIKNNTALYGRIGDGIIGIIENNYSKILSMEDKICESNEEYDRNITYYPNYILETNEYSMFEFDKIEDLSSVSMFFICSDGIENSIVEDNYTEKHFISKEIRRISDTDNIQLILEENYKKKSIDDLSLIYIKKDDVNINGYIIREYNDIGVTIKNEKCVKEEQTKEEIPQIVEEKIENNQLNKLCEQIINIEGYEYIEFFKEQTLKTYEILQKNPNIKLSELSICLQPYVEEIDFELLCLKWINYNIFVIDNDVIIRRGNYDC